MARALRPDSAFLRRLAYAGARFGPRFVIEHSPKLFGTAFAFALPETRALVRRNLRRRGYLFTTFGIPLIALLLLLGYQFISRQTASSPAEATIRIASRVTSG